MKGLILFIIKVMIVIIILLVLALVLLQWAGVSCIQRIDHSLPAAASTPWEVTTPTQLYYAENAEITRDKAGRITEVTMTGWYERLDGKWTRRDEPITLESRLVGRIEARRRVSSPQG